MTAQHTDPNEPRFAAAEPAAFAEAARIIVAALVTGGWLTIDSTTVSWIVSGIGLVASVVFTGWTRRQVTPVAAPKTAQGVSLVPARPQAPPDAPSAP